MRRKVSFNKILENEFAPKKIDINKIMESFQEGDFDIDISDDPYTADNKEFCSLAVFFGNEEIAYGKIDLETGEVSLGGSTLNEDINKAVEGKTFDSTDHLKSTLAEILNKPVEVNENLEQSTDSEPEAIEPGIDIDESADNVGIPTTEPEVTVIEEGLDPEQAIKLAKTEEELDSLASEYLMPEEYDLYIETKPDADFEDNKNFVLHLLTSGDEYESKGE